jgi:uncharacterized surface protein with fasciclin (FAS1) repeats
MKKYSNVLLGSLLCCALFTWACTGTDTGQVASSETNMDMTGQSGVQDEDSQPNVVQVAVGSKDHTTLVAAVKAAEYVDVLVNAGPFTVFAPINAAFDELPAGTLNDLLKPENKLTLQDILEYHVYVGVINTDAMKDGQRLNQVNLKNVQLSVKEDGSIMVNDAKILASVPASNGVVHVIDQVLLAE